MDQDRGRREWVTSGMSDSRWSYWPPIYINLLQVSEPFCVVHGAHVPPSSPCTDAHHSHLMAAFSPLRSMRSRGGVSPTRSRPPRLEGAARKLTLVEQQLAHASSGSRTARLHPCRSEECFSTHTARCEGGGVGRGGTKCNPRGPSIESIDTQKW